MKVYKSIKTDLGIILLLYFVLNGIFSFFSIGFDSTDNKETGTRSGLILYTDNLTGCQYLGAGDSLIPRINSDGEHICTGATDSNN